MLKTDVVYATGDCFVRQRKDGKFYYFIVDVSPTLQVKYIVFPYWNERITHKTLCNAPTHQLSKVLQGTCRAEKAECEWIRDEAFAYFQEEYRKYAELADKTWDEANKIEAIRY